jgi:hypothetical protein
VAALPPQPASARAPATMSSRGDFTGCGECRGTS